jgi:hypothetical protein
MNPGLDVTRTKIFSTADQIKLFRYVRGFVPSVVGRMTNDCLLTVHLFLKQNFVHTATLLLALQSSLYNGTQRFYPSKIVHKLIQIDITVIHNIQYAVNGPDKNISKRQCAIAQPKYTVNLKIESIKNNQ